MTRELRVQADAEARRETYAAFHSHENPVRLQEDVNRAWNGSRPGPEAWLVCLQTRQVRTAGLCSREGSSRRPERQAERTNFILGGRAEATARGPRTPSRHPLLTRAPGGTAELQAS